jgi:hypothetical protein
VLTPDSLRQVEFGSTGATNANAFTVSLANMPLPRSALMLFFATTPTQAGNPAEFDWLYFQNHLAVASTTEAYVAVQDAWIQPQFGEGFQSWSFNAPVTAPWCWCIMEWTNIPRIVPQVPPMYNQDLTGANMVTATGTTTSGSATTQTTGETFLVGGAGRADATGIYTDNLMLAAFCATASGTPPAVTGYADTVTPQAGDWVGVGSVATTNSGTKVRLDVAYKIPGALGPFDATATYASAPALMSALQVGYGGDGLSLHQERPTPSASRQAKHG